MLNDRQKKMLEEALELHLSHVLDYNEEGYLLAFADALEIAHHLGLDIRSPLCQTRSE